MVTDILKFIEEHFKGSIAVLGTGSFFNQRHEGSDIDLVLLSNQINDSYSEKIIFNDVTYDIVVLPLSHMDKIIKEDIVFKSGIVSNMLVNSTILKDQNEVAAQLIEYAKQIKYKFYQKYDDDALKKKIILLSNLVENLQSGNTFLVSFVIVSDIIQILIDLVLNSASSHPGFGKNKVSELKLNDPDFHDRLSDSLNSYFAKKDISQLLNLAKRVISESEVQTQQYSYRDLATVCSAKEQTYLIKIPTAIIKKHEILNRLHGLNKALRRIGHTIFFYGLHNDFTDIKIKGPNSFAPIDLYRMVISHIGVDPKWLSKIRITEFLPEQHMYEPFAALVEMMIKQDEAYGRSPAERLKMIYAIFNDLLGKIKLRQQEYESLIKYLLMIWEPASYDMHLKYDYKSLVKYRLASRVKNIDRIKKLNLDEIKLSPSSVNIINECSNQFYSVFPVFESKVNGFEMSMVTRHVDQKKIVAFGKHLTTIASLVDYEYIKLLILLLQINHDENKR